MSHRWKREVSCIQEEDIVHTVAKVIEYVTGFGFRILKEDVNKLPAVRQDIEIIHKDYVGTPKHERLEYTRLERDGDTIIMEIGDSKEGKLACPLR